MQDFQTFFVLREDQLWNVIKSVVATKKNTGLTTVRHDEKDIQEEARTITLEAQIHEDHNHNNHN